MTESKKTLDEKCWKGYKKKGMKTMFGKRYPNCVKVKKEGFSDWRSELEQIEEKTKLKNTNYGPAVVYQDNEKTTPARVRQQMPTGGDGTAYMGEKKEPQLPKKNNVKSLNMASVKSGEPITAKAKEMINRLLGGVDTSREDKLGKNIVNQAKKSKNSASFRAYKDVVKGTAPRRGLAKLAARAGQAISKNPKGALVAAGLVGTVAAARAIGRKFDQIKKDKKSAAITKQVDKYVADRKAPINKVQYKPTNQYTVKRDEKGKVTGTGDQIRVVPGTRTYKRMPQPGDDKPKSRFSQYTRMKLGNYGSLSPMDEKMDLKKADMGDVITDFRKSDAPQFKGKSDKKIQKMAIAAKLNAMEALDSEDVPVIKGIVKKLEGASKKHKNQAVALKKAVEENVMLTYRSGQGFDAKLGGKSVRNTVKNIKTGVDAVKNIKKEKGIVKGIKKTINDKKTTNTKTDVSTNVSDAIKNFKMKEDTAIESELVIQDWNVDDIKFTEIETVDIIKAKPLKENKAKICLLYTSPSPRDKRQCRMPSSA
mgnify:CR=1 FL=1